MPLDTIPLVPASLPVLVAGPIVRRLTRTSVTVWSAVSRADTVTLNVRLAGDLAVIGSANAAPRRVGSNLWLSVLTVQLTAGAIFQDGATYEYDLQAPGWPVAQSPDWVMDGLTYGTARPTFTGLPAMLDDLTIAHASCRKPHGAFHDGLALVDDRAAAPGGQRPNLLLLTGDQLYADDVASPLFPRLRRVAADFIGDTDSDIFPNPPLIGGRQMPSEAFGFTSGSASNHLWTFAEYAAMYLLIWSDVLWPTALPTWSEVVPAQDLAAESSLDDAAWTAELERLQAFRLGLRAVRRLLANTPTLMIFDDHEITDDWNLNRAWCEAVYGNATGRRVVANGLAAYTVFQHWGNRPLPVASTPEEVVLDGLESAAIAGSGTPITAAVEQALGLPSTPLPSAPSDFRALPDAATIRFDTALGPDDGLPVHLLLLDERTLRHFPTDNGPPGRINASGLAAMLPGPPAVGPFVPAVIVAPAPILGLHISEHFLQPAGALLGGNDGDVAVDFESWTAHRASFEALLDHLAPYGQLVLLSGDVHFGFAKRLNFADSAGTLAVAAQFTASGSKNANSLTVALHTFGELGMRLNLFRHRTFHRFDMIADTTPFISPPSGATVPWDDLVDILLGRVAREAIRQPAVLSREVAQAYSLTNPDARYDIDIYDDERLPAAPQVLQDVVNLNHVGWNPDESVQIIRALQQVDLHRMGRVFAGLPQAGLITFQTAPALSANQELLMAVGGDVTTAPTAASVAAQVSLTGPPPA